VFFSLFKNLFSLFLWIFSPPCNHKFATIHRWVTKDGMPMMHFICDDCGLSRYEEVPNANPGTWGLEDDSP
jgi:hypothetical protein